MKRAKEPDR